MKGATLAVLQIEWERAWMAKDFDRVSRIDAARHVIEGLAAVRPQEAAPRAEEVRETAPRQRFRLDCRMFARLKPSTQ